jgi:putative Ca2+/H+ antiporter (TMEM165/GDT1 family)
MHLDIGVFVLVFSVIFVAELPDKSLFAALVLGNRFPAFWVWLGAASAFLVHVIIAVSAGKLLTLLPHQLMEIIIALLFFGGAILLLSGKHGLEQKPQRELKSTHSPLRVYATAFSVIFIGEWGDITQIATANYAAKYHAPWSVGIAAVLALWIVTGLAIVAGSKLLKLVPQKMLLRFMGFVMLLFAVLSAISAFK